MILHVLVQIDEYQLANVQRDFHRSVLLTYIKLSTFSPCHCCFIFFSAACELDYCIVSWLWEILGISVAAEESLRLVSPIKIWRLYKSITCQASFLSSHIIIAVHGTENVV